MKEYRLCSDCGKPFLVPLKSDGTKICPYCFSSNTYTITKKDYDKYYHLKIKKGVNVES